MSTQAGLLLAAFGVGVLFDALFLARARREKDRAALRAIELRNSALLRAMPDLMFVHGRDGTYLDYHAKDPSDLLVPPEIFIGKSMADIMPPALHAIFQRCFDEAMETGGPAVAEYDLQVRGELRHYEARVVTGDDETLVSIVRDVTDAKRTTEKLRKSDEFNRRIIESSSDGIKVLDLEGRLKWMSRTALRQVDLEEFTIENLRVPDFLSDNDRQAALAAFARARSGEPGSYQAYAPTTKGNWKWWDVSVSPMTDSEGNVTSLLAVSRDMTERKKAEDALSAAQSELARASRALTLGTLTSAIAHEIGQPLGALLLNARTAERLVSAEPVDVEIVRRVTRDIAQDAMHLSEVVTRVRELFTNVPPKRTLIDLNEVIEEVVGALEKETSPRGVSIRTDLELGLPLIAADRVQMHQVLQNLLRNGVDATTIEADDVARVVTVRSRRVEGMKVQVDVVDRGTGFRPQDVDRLFDPFYSTKPEGMGLGLAMSRMIVGAHGGTLTAHANADRGSTFRFVLAAVSPEAALADIALSSGRNEQIGRSVDDRRMQRS